MTDLPASLADRVVTNQGIRLPWLGLGVFQSPPGEVTRRAVRWALEAGYRLIDTAAMYGNEADVGAAVRESGLGRDEIVVTSKLWHTEHGFDTALAAARKSYEALGLGPIDLYLIHWPIARSPSERLASWKALEKLHAEGTARAIGVANYAIRHLEELREHSGIVPAVDQVEYHPFVRDAELEAYLDRRGIRLEAYSPLTRGRQLDDPRFAKIAAAHGRSAAQVLIRWGLQHGAVEIPKSVHRERIVENSRVFDFALAPSEMRELDGLTNGSRVTRTNPREIA